MDGWMDGRMDGWTDGRMDGTHLLAKLEVTGSHPNFGLNSEIHFLNLAHYVPGSLRIGLTKYTQIASLCTE